jgi:hypothetical protein
MDPAEKTDIPQLPANKTPTPVMSMIFRSRGFVLALKILIAFIAALLIFQLGMYVGFLKANYSFSWGDNYHRTFGGPRGGFMRSFEGKDFMNGHGTAGTIASIDNSGIVVKGVDGMEKMVTISGKTSIMNGHMALKASDLQIDEMVTVIGQPQNDGTVQAEIIRVFGTPVVPPSAPSAPSKNY